MPQKNIESLFELASILNQQNDYQEILRLVTQKASHLLRAKLALIMMVNPRTRETVKTVYKEGKSSLENKHHLVHTMISGWVIKNKTPFFSKDIKTDSRIRKDLFKEIDSTSVLCVPLSNENNIIGTILLLDKIHHEQFSKSDLEFLEKFANIVSPFLRNIQKIQQYFTPALPTETLLKKFEAFGLLGRSPKFVELLKSIDAAAKCDVRVLLEGESGTGKELIAKAIHQLSPRIQHKFVTIDCGAIPANLIESELFGHVKGAFTGAASPRKGLMEEANNGTLFMDEISNLPLGLQAKFLRTIQEGQIRPLGSNETKEVNVRIISACSTRLYKLVENNQFREDLFYRLHVYPIGVPSLNARKDDIPLLVNNFVQKFSQQQNKKAEFFHEEVLEFLQHRHWAGNIRELENFVERLVTLAKPNVKVLDISILPAEFHKEWKNSKTSTSGIKITKSLTESLKNYEEQLIRQALIENGWNQSKAARALKISEQTIRYKMGKLCLEKPQN